MRILHTSDWHLGAQLHEQSRIPEQTAFLVWLKTLMAKEHPDALIIAGDVFDTCAPSNTALSLYYDFLSDTITGKLCRTIIVVGGNHDSPSLLDAPGNLLVHFQTRVIGSIDYHQNQAGEYTPNCQKEIVVVKDAKGEPGLVIGAVPYLRDADLRKSVALETDADRTAKLAAGFKNHYAKVAELARRETDTAASNQLPFVLTGHLFLTGGLTAEDGSERDIQIGHLKSLDMDLLPKADYYALGHLHSPQIIGNNHVCRYSGAPIAMSFGEERTTKSVTIVEFAPGAPPNIRLETVPQTQALTQLKGAPENIEQKLKELVTAGASVWVDLQVTEGIGDLTSWWTIFPAIVENTPVRILRWQNARPGRTGATLGAAAATDTNLDQLKPRQLFEMRLMDEDLTENQRTEFTAMFAEVFQSFEESDTQRE